MNSVTTRPGAIPSVLVLEDGRWTVPDLDRILEIAAERRARGSWVYLVGCKRCMTVCSDAGVCKCCAQPKAARQYDLAGSHVHILLMDEFLAQHARKAAV